MERYSSHSDQQLVALLKGSDRKAFSEIYERYHALLFAYAYHKLLNKQEAQDIVQEVFITLWENRETFVLKTFLSGFLYKSVLNKILNIWKHNKIVREHASIQNLSIDIDSYETDFLIREKEIAALIEKEIAALPPRTREVYELKYKAYLSTKDVAERLGISENTVSNHLKNATSRLKKNLGAVIFILYLLEK